MRFGRSAFSFLRERPGGVAIKAAGFVLGAETAILANGDDAHLVKVFDTSVKGHTDGFDFRFVKPWRSCQRLPRSTFGMRRPCHRSQPQKLIKSYWQERAADAALHEAIKSFHKRPSRGMIVGLVWALEADSCSLGSYRAPLLRCRQL